MAAAHCEHFLSVAETAAPHLTGPDKGSGSHGWTRISPTSGAPSSTPWTTPNGTAMVLRFAVALRYYWLARSRREEAFSLLVPVLERPEADAEPELLVDALVTVLLGGSPRRHTRLRKASPSGPSRSHDTSTTSGYPCAALAVLGGAYYFSGESGEAFPLGQGMRRAGPNVRRRRLVGCRPRPVSHVQPDTSIRSARRSSLPRPCAAPNDRAICSSRRTFITPLVSSHYKWGTLLALMSTWSSLHKPCRPRRGDVPREDQPGPDFPRGR